MKQRLDQSLVVRGLVRSRSQAESYVKLGKVQVQGRVMTKPGFMVSDDVRITISVEEQYVSRAALKLASVAEILKLDFNNKTVLDVGSSTGGFTDYALRRGADYVIAVEVGTDQLHPSLQGHPRIELHEQTDIRAVSQLSRPVDIVVADVSFISLREILPQIVKLVTLQTQIVVMVKPQFEAEQSSLKHKGVIKNDTMRREILKSFEVWAREHFLIIDKADSAVAGAKGNRERFYLLKTSPLAKR
ncbi:MAG: TlyA family RNA methyltransferase [Candidatus Saccharibacteria bacterium]